MRAIPNGEAIVRAALVRGLDAAALSRLAGVVPATTARAMASQPINVKSFIAITRAIARAKVEPGADGFLRCPGVGEYMAPDMMKPADSGLAGFVEEGTRDADLS
jgi:hypothetical protein